MKTYMIAEDSDSEFIDEALSDLRWETVVDEGGPSVIVLGSLGRLM